MWRAIGEGSEASDFFEGGDEGGEDDDHAGNCYVAGEDGGKELLLVLLKGSDCRL